MSTNSKTPKLQNSKSPTGPRIFFLFWATCFLLPISCVEETERLTKAERKVVDTLVLRETKILRAMGDSLCEINFEASVRQLVDSIIVERYKDIRKIFNK